MTIDSSWIVALKKSVPEAFTCDLTFTPGAIFCDGQIRLCAPCHSEGTLTWDDYIHRQYELYLRRCYASGVDTVIMAFDDYNHVPTAKSMTQSKRRKNIPQIDFSDRDALPPTVPESDVWGQYMANRTFKTRLIHLLTFTLGKRALQQLSPNQSLIIDWQDQPLLFRGGALEPEPLTQLAPLGESDVKFVQYAGMFPKIQVDSIDGDSIPIALLKLQTGFEGNFSIYHLETKVDPPTRKRLVTGEPAPPPKRQRVYEHVNIRILYNGILRRVIPKRGGIQGHEISMLVSLIGLSGTDFTRSLPLVSGKTLYEMIPDIWPALTRTYDPDTRSLVTDRVADILIAKIYHMKFQKHTAGGTFASLLTQINASKLGEKTKQALPSAPEVHCNARNINWLLAYWTHLQYPDPIQYQYGFARSRNGKISHDDQ